MQQTLPAMEVSRFAVLLLTCAWALSLGQPCYAQSSVPQQQAAASAQAAAGQTVDPGELIFSQRCARCHGEHGEGRSAMVGTAGPNIQAEHDPGRVMAAVEYGPSHMPSFAYVLSVPEMHAVSRYVSDKLAVIPLGQGDEAYGGELFRKYCATCHRTDVRGGALVYAGANAPNLTDKSAELLAGAIRWGPGPMPSFPPSILSDSDVASIVAYIRRVQSPPHPGGNAMKWIGPVAEGFAAWILLFGLMGAAGWIERGGKG